MKKFGIMIIALALLIVGMAMAESVCPFDEPDSPEEAPYIPTTMGFQTAGTGIGHISYKESVSAMGMQSGNLGTTSEVFDAFGRGPFNYAFTTDVTLGNGTIDVTSQRAVEVGIKPGMISAGMILREGNYLSSCGTFEPFEDTNTSDNVTPVSRLPTVQNPTGYSCAVTDPYCEKAYTTTSAMLGQGTYVSQATLANKPTGIMLMQQSAVSGSTGIPSGFASGSITMGAGFSSISTNLDSSGEWSTRWVGDFQAASQYNYVSQKVLAAV